MVLATMQWESVKAQENKPHLSDTTEYVRISLLVAGPGTAVYSLFGHAAIRVEMPLYFKDQVWSYDSSGSSDFVEQYLMGNIRSCVKCRATNAFVSTYRREDRQVTAYRIKMTQSEAVKVWHLLNDEMNMGGDRPYDLYNNCGSFCTRVLLAALESEPDFNPWPSIFDEPVQNVIYDRAKKIEGYKWQKLLAKILFSGKADESRSKTDKLVVPNDIVDAFRRAGLIMDEKVLE